MRFGRQRPPAEIAALVLLLIGFSALAVAFHVYTANWAGLFLPLGFLIGIYASYRAEVKEIELRAETLVVRTFFRAYAIPRAHVTSIARTPEGTAVEVLNGNRYLVTPPGTDAEEIARALEAWI